MRRSFFLLGFISSVILLLAVGYYAYRSYDIFEKDAALVEKAHQVEIQINKLVTFPKSITIYVRGAYITGNFDELLQRMEKAQFREYHMLDSLVKQNKRQAENSHMLFRLLNKHNTLAHKVMEIMVNEKAAKDSLQILIRKEEAALDSIKIVAESMRNEEYRQLQNRRSRLETANPTPVALAALTLLSLGIIAALYMEISDLLRKNEKGAADLRSRLSDLNVEFQKRTSAEELLRGVLNTSPCGIVAFEAVRNDRKKITDFRCVLANNMAAEIMRIPQPELLEKSLLSTYPGSQNSGLLNMYINVVETGTILRTEKHFNYDGFDSWFDITAVKRNDGLVMTFSDITIIKKHEKEILKKTRELQKSNEDLEHFAYIASHDLQEPLRKVRSFGDRLVKLYGNTLEERGRDFIARMINGAERMDILINDLLKFSRISRTELLLQNVNLNQVLHEVCEDLNPISAKVHTQIKFNSLPSVMGDPVQLHQLFQNLISNAIKYARHDVSPRIEISASHTENEKTPTNSHKRRYWKIEVKDNGIGFDPKYKEQIFIIFQRLHGRTEYSGTGIGLSICQKIVFNHGGLIEADSIPGEGSVFTIYLPANG